MSDAIFTFKDKEKKSYQEISFDNWCDFISFCLTNTLSNKEIREGLGLTDPRTVIKIRKNKEAAFKNEDV